MQQLVILLVINCPSTCFRRLYAHPQEVRLRFHCLAWLAVKQPTPHSAHSLPADSPTSQQLQQDRKPHAVKTQSDLLRMGVKRPKHVEEQLITNKITNCCIQLVSPLFTNSNHLCVTFVVGNVVTHIRFSTIVTYWN